MYDINILIYTVGFQYTLTLVFIRIDNRSIPSSLDGLAVLSQIEAKDQTLYTIT